MKLVGGGSIAAIIILNGIGHCPKGSYGQLAKNPDLDIGPDVELMVGRDAGSLRNGI